MMYLAASNTHTRMHTHTGESLPPVNSSQSNTITVNFKPLRENGLLLLLTQDSDPVFAVGIFNGEVCLFLSFSLQEFFESLRMFWE